jgi:hypothetical protein
MSITPTPVSRYTTPRMHFTDLAPGRPCAKDPAVVRVDERYLLYYSVPPASPAGRWSIGIAESGNLLDWQTIGTIAFDDGIEAQGIAAPGAIVLAGRIHLFYQSYGYGRDDAICHAVSADGIHFERSRNPVFRPGGDWTCGRAIDADVVVFNNRLMLYYATRDPEMRVQMLGVASADLTEDLCETRWTNQSEHGPLLRPRTPTPLDPAALDLDWEGECIEAPAAAVREGRVYLFYGGGYNNAPQQIGLAVSEDGIQFRRQDGGRPVVPVGQAGAWNDRESGHPYYFDDERGDGWLFLQGNNAAESSAAGKDTWYLSTMRVTWHRGADGVLFPRISDPADGERHPV